LTEEAAGGVVVQGGDLGPGWGRWGGRLKPELQWQLVPARW
jgi:hypothetical protein